MWKIIVGVLFIFAIISLCTGCVSKRAVTRDESLVESRISAAVLAERARWSTELSQYITDGLSELNEKVGAVRGASEQLNVALEEYRRFTLGLIDRVQYLESEGRDEGQVVMDRDDSGNYLLDP